MKKLQTNFDDSKLIFLISQPRSGSTLLQRMLSVHPEIHSTAEPWLMLHPVYALRNEGYEAKYNEKLAHQALEDFLLSVEGGRKVYLESLRRMALYLYEESTKKAGKSYFLDKTPRYYYIISELSEIFPNAHFILLFRNPLAILASAIQAWYRGNWIRFYNFHDDLIVAPKLLNRAKSQLAGHVNIVHYEDLVRDPRVNLAVICSSLEIEYFPGMIDYGKYPKPVGSLGDEKSVNKHLNPNQLSLTRWHWMGENKQTRHFASSYLNKLGPDLLKDLGYDMKELQLELNSIPVNVKGPIVKWDFVFREKHNLATRYYLAAIELLQQRRFIHSAKQFLKITLGKY